MDTSYGDTTVTTPDSSRDPPGSASERETDLLGKAEAGSEDDHHQYLTTSNFLALLALSATYVGSNLGTYFIGATVTFIETDLNVGSNTTWLLIGGNLAFACVAPCAGYLQDIFGRRTALIVGSLGNILGAILTGAANGFAMAITGLIISGIGGAIGELTATAAIAEIVPIRKRGLFLAINTAMNIPFIPSILYAELLSTRYTWRWCYWITLIWNVVTFISLIATYFRLDIQRIDHEAKISGLKSIDYLGMFLLVASCTLILVGLQPAGTAHAWNSAFVLCLLLIGILVFVVFLLWEWRGAKSPVVPFRLFKGQRVVGVTFLIAFIAGVNYSVSLGIGPTLLSEIFQPGPTLVGLYALGPTAGLIIGATSINILFAYFKGRARELLFGAAVIITAFAGASLSVSPVKPASYIVLSSIASLGLGGLLIPISTVATIACPQDLIGTAVALTAAIRTIGGAIGFPVVASIIKSAAEKKIPKSIGTYAVKAGLPEKYATKFVKAFYYDPELAAKIPGVTKSILKAAELGQQWGYAKSYDSMFYLLLAFGLVAMGLCLALPDMTKYMTDKVVAPARRTSTLKDVQRQRNEEI